MGPWGYGLVLAIGAGCVLLSGCELGKGPVRRPANVPKAAVWAGGPKGGNWFLCNAIGEKEFTYHCTVYYEDSGNVAADGDYVLRMSYWNKGQNKREIQEFGSPTLSYGFFNGHELYLQNMVILVPPPKETGR